MVHFPDVYWKAKEGTREKMNVNIEESWKQVLADEFNSIYFARLAAFVKSAYASGMVYPPGKYIFEAFNRTPFDKVKVVILGQDPYHAPFHATLLHGRNQLQRLHLPRSLNQNTTSSANSPRRISPARSM